MFAFYFITCLCECNITNSSVYFVLYQFTVQSLEKKRRQASYTTNALINVHNVKMIQILRIYNILDFQSKKRTTETQIIMLRSNSPPSRVYKSSGSTLRLGFVSEGREDMNCETVALKCRNSRRLGSESRGTLLHSVC